MASEHTTRDEDRRDPRVQRPALGGRRAMDPTLTTRDVANLLGTSTQFVRGEILDGRLTAMVLERPGKRAIYRIAPIEVDAYKIRCRWSGLSDAGAGAPGGPPASDRPVR